MRSWLRVALLPLCLLAALTAAGCATVAPFDYSEFERHPPRSILVLPPLNETTTVTAGYSYLSTVSQPLAEHGYYVFPVAVVEQLMRDNGLPTAGEMHEVPPAKLREITGADSVLYVVVHEYGSKYLVIGTTTTVRLSARLVDATSGVVLWTGSATVQQGSSSSGNLLADLIAAPFIQAINSTTDAGRGASRVANAQLVSAKQRGLPYGPYHAKAGKYP